MNKDALRKYYESFLPVIGLDIGDDDFLRAFTLDTEGEKIGLPMLVNNLGVIFPTDGVLREGKWTDRVGFHPLSESITRGVSPMLIACSAAARYKIYQAIFHIGANLIRVAKESHEGTIKNMPPKLVEALGTLPKTVDAKSLSFFSKVLAADNDKDRSVVKICIKRNGTILGQDYKRITSTYFPIYDQLVEAIENKESEFWGVTAARKSDIVLIKEVIEIILPDVDDENRYCSGSHVNVAPYLDSFIRSLSRVQDSLNNAMDLLGTYIPSNIHAAFHASTDFIEELGDNRDLRNIIPPLKFNEGEITEDEERERETSNIVSRPERSSAIPDFETKGNDRMKRASEIKPSTGGGGRRYIDNTLTEQERTDPVRAERRHSSRDEDDDYYRRDDRDRGRDRDRGSSRDRDRDDRSRSSRDRGRDRDDRGGRDRDRDRGRDRYDDRRDDRNDSWENRNRGRSRR